VKIDFGDLDVYDIEPEVSPDLLAERPLVVFGKYRGQAKSTIEVSGYTGSGKYSRKISLENAKPHPRQSAIRQLWARERIRLLDDYQKRGSYSEGQLEVTKLGLKYNLMTAYTSFVAVEKDRVANKEGNSNTVKQPLPLPQGVPNSAVGFDMAFEQVVRWKKPKRILTIQAIDCIDTGLVKEKVYVKLDEQFKNAPECVKKTLSNPTKITLIFDANGKVVSIKWDKNQELPQCLKGFCEKIMLPAIAIGNTNSVTIKIKL